MGVWPRVSKYVILGTLSRMCFILNLNQLWEHLLMLLPRSCQGKNMMGSLQISGLVVSHCM
nr:hypothetical protein Iba_chr14fCG13150 [Ipomoea batatas]